MTLLQDPDQTSLSTDPSITLYTADGRQQSVVPFKLGGPQIVASRRDIQSRPYPVPHQPPPPLPAAISLPPVSGTPISIPTQVKKMPHAPALPQLRISSNGGMRHPGLVVTGLPANTSLPQSSPTNNVAPPINGINGIHRGGITASPRDNVKIENN